jgi:hypothetical protein
MYLPLSKDASNIAINAQLCRACNRVQCATAFLACLQPGKPDQSVYIERFNRSYRTEVLNAHPFESIAKLRADGSVARVYNQERPDDSLGRMRPSRFTEAHNRGLVPWKLSARVGAYVSHVLLLRVTPDGETFESTLARSRQPAVGPPLPSCCTTT